MRAHGRREDQSRRPPLEKKMVREEWARFPFERWRSCFSPYEWAVLTRWREGKSYLTIAQEFGRSRASVGGALARIERKLASLRVGE